VGGAHDLKDTRSHQDGQAFLRIEAAEDVIGKEGQIDIPKAAGMAMAGAVEGQKLDITFIAQGGGDQLLVVGLDVESEPGRGSLSSQANWM
jgi:hypothetical protein